MKKRIALYVFWEKDRVVRQYVLYYLNALKEVAQDIVFIANGELQDEGKQKLKELGVQVVQRENEGLDFAAWQAVILEKRDEIANNYDELILCNSSCYGPVWPFSRCFEKMEAKDCDFWGMTLHSETDDLLVPGDKSSHVLEHLQSYFLVFRSVVLKSEAWLRWWQQMRRAETYSEVVGYQETKLTAYLAQNHFSYTSLMDYTWQEGFGKGVNASMLGADVLLHRDGVPLVKRKLFSTSITQLDDHAISHAAARVFRYLERYTDYPMKYIWEDLLATKKLSDIKDSVHLNYVLSSVYADSATEYPQDVALICYGYYPDLAEEMVRYISTMPLNAHIYIISSREDTLAAYRACMDKTDYTQVEYRMKPNRGRDISALLVTAKDIVAKHEYICYIHDKKTTQVHPLLGREFMLHCMECCLHSKPYVLNLLKLMQTDNACGMLVPPSVNITLINPLGDEIGGNEDCMRQVYESCKLQCPFDTVPVAPFGTCFWSKREALLPMYRKDWQMNDFPDEPLPVDATISHGIERILPMAAQDAGYYTAWCSPDSYAEFYMNDLSIKLREFIRTHKKLHGHGTWLSYLHCCEPLKKKVCIKLAVRRIRFKLQYWLSFGMWKKMLVKIQRIDKRLAAMKKKY